MCDRVSRSGLEPGSVYWRWCCGVGRCGCFAKRPYGRPVVRWWISVDWDARLVRGPETALPKVYGGRVRRYRTRVNSGCRRSCGTMPSVLGTGRRGMTAEDLMNGQPLLEVDGLRVYFPIITGLMRRERGYVRVVGRELQPAEGRDRPARSAGVAGSCGR